MKNKNSTWQKTEEQGYYISISDLMSGLLFIFIITLVVFAMNLKGTQVDLSYELVKQKNEKEKLTNIVHTLTNSNEIRAQILREIQEKLKKKGFRVQVDLEHGILRLPEEILFPSGSATLQPGGKRMIKVLAAILAETLPEFVIFEDDSDNVKVVASILAEKLPAFVSGANDSNNGVHRDRSKAGMVDAIFIEGHTDDRPVSSRCKYENNWDLSAARAIATYDYLTEMSVDLKNYLNQKRQPVFSVSGYADSRPIVPNNSAANRRHNRRIDLRFIMTPPEVTPAVIKAIEKKLN